MDAAQSPSPTSAGTKTPGKSRMMSATPFGLAIASATWTRACRLRNPVAAASAGSMGPGRQAKAAKPTPATTYAAPTSLTKWGLNGPVSVTPGTAPYHQEPANSIAAPLPTRRTAKAAPRMISLARRMQIASLLKDERAARRVTRAALTPLRPMASKRPRAPPQRLPRPLVPSPRQGRDRRSGAGGRDDLAGDRGGRGRGGGRRGVLQHRHDRLPGDSDRSLVHGADRRLHVPARRQCRRQPRGHRAVRRRRGDRGLCAVFRDVPTDPANWRAQGDLDGWLKRRGVIALAGVDTRSLTLRIRESGMPHAVIAHAPEGGFDLEALVARARAWPGVVGLDLAKDASCLQPFTFDEGLWAWPEGYAEAGNPRYEVVVVDYGVKRNILRALTSIGARATVVPASTTAEAILARNPDGVLLSNGPGDPAATGAYAVPEIRALVDSGKAVFGICLGHQMLALALGARTRKMDQGHHGANHPVKDLTTGKVEIVSMNHGFTVDRDTLPAPVVETHVSLFDGTNAGLALKDRPVFSIQHHPEASPGPTDSLYLFERFAALMDEARTR